MKHAPRLPYCGTCKTLGVRYGQRSRMLLNHDMVFLAELLMHYSGEPEWTAVYRSYNCFAKPKEIFPILDYVAAATVVIAHYRVADNIDDSGRWHWRAIARMLSPQFRRARAKLRELGVPMEQLDSILHTQRAREASPKSLFDVAEPTAIATSMVFAHSARFGGDAKTLRDIGHQFGYLIYILDAFEDRVKDARSGAFNALARFPEIDGRAEILRTVDEIQLPADLKDRLRANVEVRLGLRPRVLCCVSRKTLRQRWQDAMNFARRMREREQIGLAMFATAAVIALLFPHHARGSVSSRECATIPFNLMALSSFLAAPAAPPVKPKSKGGCASNCCCCDGCGDCDCCCDADCCGSCCDCSC